MTTKVTYTPWGWTFDIVELAEGIWRVWTPSHAGLKLSRERWDSLPATVRETMLTPGFAEEDCMEPSRTRTYRLYTRDQRGGRTNSAGSGFGSANSKGPPLRKLSELLQHPKVTAAGLGEAFSRRRSTGDPQLLGEREKGSIDQAASLGTPLCSFGPIGMRGPEIVPERAGPTSLAATPTHLIPTPSPRRTSPPTMASRNSKMVLYVVQLGLAGVTHS